MDEGIQFGCPRGLRGCQPAGNYAQKVSLAQYPRQRFVCVIQAAGRRQNAQARGQVFESCDYRLGCRMQYPPNFDGLL